ncbi:hypothetical protein MNBD_GAMMA10-577 [hydrothermal vent metagenome]|uniref:Uncharacterized protein n=1 Tax=hydrothermal vent metagenome TaxID=652676 RepID=A0A3B0XGG3_9ZZZZ
MFKNIFKPKIEKILGYEITDDEMNSVDDFRCLSDEKISDLKKIAEKDEFFAKYYLEYIATERNRKYAFSFVVDINNGLESVKDWMKDAVLIVDFKLDNIINLKSIYSMVEPLECFSKEEGYSKICFDLERWNYRVPYVGSVCVNIPEYDYRTILPDHVKEIYDKKIKINKICNPEIESLRWLSSYMAVYIWPNLTNRKVNKRSFVELYEQRLKGKFKLNPAIKSAIKVLEKELEQIGGYYTDGVAPGYTLDDEQIKKYL